MTLNHKRIGQILHGITIIAFTISVLFQLKNLYVYGGKPPKQIDDENEPSDEEPVEEKTEFGRYLDNSMEAKSSERIRENNYE